MDAVYGIDQLTMKLITNWIDMSTGNFLVKLDPYREPEDNSKNFRDQWFDDKGYLKREIVDALYVLVKEKKYEWMADCDIPKLLGAHHMSYSTKGSYPCIYYWRYNPRS